MNNAIRKELLQQTKEAQRLGFQGSVIDVLQNPTVLQEFLLNSKKNNRVEIAATPEQQQQGLRGRSQKELPSQMIFPNVSPNTPFNTVGMKAPINIKKYDEQGHLVKSYENVPPGLTNLPMGPQRGTVIETPANVAQSGGKKISNKYSDYMYAQAGVQKNNYYSHRDSIDHQADKILQYEQLKGGPGGTPLPSYSNPKYKSMIMNYILPEVNKIMPNASAIEKAEAIDFIFNAGWDKSNNTIKKDPRAYAIQEYYRKFDPSKLDKDGKWAGRKNAPYSFDQEYANTIGKLSENERRILMNKGRDWYYQNINNPSPGVPSSDYYDTWYGRIWNTNDFSEFNPNNRNLTHPSRRKQNGGMKDLGKVTFQSGGLPGEFMYKSQSAAAPLAYTSPTANGYLLPDPNRPELMNTGATEYKAGFDDITIPTVVNGQYFSPDNAYKRYKLTGEKFKPMADPSSYSKFYDEIGRLGIMKNQGGGQTNPPTIKQLFEGVPQETVIEKDPTTGKELFYTNPNATAPSKFNLKTFKRGVSYVESKDGKYMKNPSSSATGLYGQLYNEVKDLPELKNKTRDDFAADTALQNKILDLRVQGKIPGIPGIQKSAEDIYNEYSKQIANFPYDVTEVGALVNFLGRQGTREYLGYVVRDKKDLKTVFPKLYGDSVNVPNKTPDEYITEFRTKKRYGGPVKYR